MSDDSLVDALGADGWQPGAVPGLTEKVLWERAPHDASVALLRFAAGSGIPDAHEHPSSQLMYCLEGRYAYPGSGMVLEPGSFYANPAGHRHGPTEAIEDTLLLEIYDGRHYAGEAEEEIAPEFRVGTQLLHSNVLVNVWDVTLAPGETVPWHRHRYPYAVIIIETGEGEITDYETGASFKGAGVVGSVVYDPGGTHHMLRNVGTTTLRDRLIEFKTPSTSERPERAVLIPEEDPHA